MMHIGTMDRGFAVFVRQWGSHYWFLCASITDINLILQFTKNDTTDPYTKSGIYKLSCTTCEHSYVGQTGKNLKQKYKEHIRYIWNDDPQSAYAAHIINNLHEYGNIYDNMSMLQKTNKGPYMNTLEQFYIQQFAYNKRLIPEQNMGDPNPIFHFIYDIQKRHSPTWQWPT